MMNWQYTPFMLPVLVAAVVSGGLAFYSWRRRPAVGAIPFALLMLAVAEWSLANVLRLGSTDLAGKIFWAKVRYVGIVVAPTAWLAFALQYTGLERWLKPHNVAMLAFEPLTTLLLAWTNEAHHLIWTDIRVESRGTLLLWNALHGAAFWVHAAYSYLLFILTTFLLVRALIRSPRLYRGQIGALLVGALVPLVGNVSSTLRLVPFPLDLTPFAFTVAGLPIAWSLFRFRLLDIVPMARGAVVESMGDGVFVLDVQDRVVDINPAAERLIGRPASEVVGQPIARMLAGRPDLIEQYGNVTKAHSQITLGEGKAQRIYELRISPLHDRRGHLGGRLVVLRDVTEYRQVEAGLRAQKQLFESLMAMARATAKYPSLEGTLQSVLNMAATLTGAEHSSMFLLDGTRVTHSILARDEATPAQHQDLVRRVMEEGLAGWVVRQQRPALIYDTSRDDRWVDLPDVPYAARSALSIPIVSGSAVLGVLNLTHSEPGHFSAEAAYLIQSAADQISMAVRNAQMYDEQRRLADRQTKLYEALRAVGEHLDLDTIAHAAVEAIARLTGWPDVAILLPEEVHGAEGRGANAHGATVTHLLIRAAVGTLSVGGISRIPVDQGIAGRAFRTAQTQYVPDVSEGADHKDITPVFRSELAVPLRRGERVMGVLNVANDRVSAFSADDILLARSLAEAVALALDNARLYAEIRRYAADLGALYTISHAIGRSLVLEGVLSETLHSALTSLDFDAGRISLVDPSDGRLYVAAEQGLPPSSMSDRLRQEGLEGTFCACVHERGENIVVGDVRQETPAMSALKKELPLAVSEIRDLGMRAYSGICLLHQERSLGTLGLFARQSRVLSVEDQALQIAIGRQIATAVTNARLFQAVADERSRLQALIESNRDGIVLIGMDQRMLVVNAPALHLLRLSGQPDDWVNRSIQHALATLEHHAPDAVEAILAEMRRVRMGDRPPGEGECEVPPHTIHWLSLPVMTGTTPLGRLLVLRDVTEERLLARMRDDLIHAMVHDLRNPLTAISASLSFLEEVITDTLLPSHQELWEIAQNSTKGMLQLVNAILDMSRLESRQMPLDHTLIPLNSLVASVLNAQASLAADGGLHLEADVPPTLPPAWGDAGLIERVLRNLVDNAIKFTPEGGVVRVTAKVEAAGQVEASGRSKIHVSVSDTGSGIPPEIQERLFQKFVTGRQEKRGSGLGLAFCRMVVEAHGERIWVESTSESGTTFIFTLPLPPGLE